MNSYFNTCNPKPVQGGRLGLFPSAKNLAAEQNWKLNFNHSLSIFLTTIRPRSAQETKECILSTIFPAAGPEAFLQLQSP